MGYGRLPEVYSALEFERMNFASGPTGGEVRMKNGQKAQERSPGALRGLARPALQRALLSRVLHNSLKFAHLIKGAHGRRGLQLYIDMRCFAKVTSSSNQRLLDGRYVLCADGWPHHDFALMKTKRASLVVAVEDTLLAETMAKRSMSTGRSGQWSRPAVCPRRARPACPFRFIQGKVGD